MSQGQWLTKRVNALTRRAAPAMAFAKTHLGSRSGRRFPRASHYFKGNKVAGYIGWVGNGNVGDEAMYLAFGRLFPSFDCLLYDRLPFELLLYRKYVARAAMYNFVAVGGGTLFSYPCYYYQADHAINQGIPVFTFGTGADDPSLLNHGDPSRDESLLDKFATLLKDARIVTTRGPRTKRCLEIRGVKDVYVIGDPALSACTPVRGTGEQRVGISLAHRSYDVPPAPSALQANLAKVVRYLLDKGRKVDFFPMGKGDAQLGRQFLRDFPTERVRVVNARDPMALMSRLSGCEMVIGERLHSMILAAGSGVPCISLAYRPKCRDFMESVEMERFCLDFETLSADKMIGLVDEVSLSRDAISRHLIERTDHYRTEQALAARRISSLMASLQPDENMAMSPDEPEVCRAGSFRGERSL